MIGAIRRYIYAIAAGAVLFIGALLYRKGVTDTREGLEIDDLKKANGIRRRADAARELHDNGIEYRD